MDVSASLDTDAPPGDLLAVVSDLSRCPEWLSIVPRAESVATVPDDPGPAWSVDLRAQLGPLRRSKRLRMVRSRFDTLHPDGDDGAPAMVRFIRRELDGRAHSAWILDATVTPTDDGSGSMLTMRLHYGGTLWMPMLDRLLADEIERSRPRLISVVGSGP